MLNFQNVKQIVILGGGTAGWFAALSLRSIFSPSVTLTVVESPEVGIVGVGEGGLLNLVAALRFYGVDIDDFIKKTGATYKLGFSYEGWRTGAKEDVFYHPFASDQRAEAVGYNGYYPLMAALLATNTPFTEPFKTMPYVSRNVTQDEAKQHLDSGQADILASYHFDSHKVASYLKDIAMSRGVQLKSAYVQDAVLDAETGCVTALQLRDEEEPMPVDFLVDASGFARLIIGKKYNSEWLSFRDYLILDRAIPFHMSHPYKNPYLLTRAIAMPSGWMWQIPLQHRVGAGYVYSSQHISDDAALQEINKYLGFDIEPMKTLRFEPGCFCKVWQGNVVAIGLASGFVEPLEATSIGQMLEQVRNIRRVIFECRGVVAQSTIDCFNEANAQYWRGIRDFLRMHYDTKRADTPFWQAVTKLPYPESYAALKHVWQYRSPVDTDISQYHAVGWRGMFHVHNWMFVAQPLGLLSTAAAQREMKGLPADVQKKVVEFMQGLPSAAGAS